MESYTLVKSDVNGRAIDKPEPGPSILPLFAREIRIAAH